MVAPPPPRESPPPRVSVVIPVYNRADCIALSLETALAQTHPAFEVIVVDDGSTDGVAGLIAERFPAVRVIRLERRGGVAHARNAGVATARGDLIAFLDSDDLWSPEKLAIQVADLDRHPGAVLSFTDSLCGLSGDAEPFSQLVPPRDGSFVEQLLEGCPILTASAVVIRRSLFDRVGGFDESLATSSDRDLWLRYAACGAVRFVPLPLIRRVVRSDSLWYSREGWERSAGTIIEKFLARPEGRPFRRRRRALQAWRHFRLGAHNAFAGHWLAALRSFFAAHARDPVVALRKRRGVIMLFKVAAVAGGVGLRKFFGTKELQRLAPALRRASGVLAGARPPDETWAGTSFRLPPDASLA